MTLEGRDLVWVTLTWWGVSLSGVLMPGPVSAMAVSEGARRGCVAGPLLTGGHAAAETILVALLGLGLGHVLHYPLVIGAIGLGGGGVLWWMGWGTVAAARFGPADAPVREGEVGPSHGLLRAGVLATAGNPYWLLWWATVGAAYFVAFSRFGVAAIVVLFLLGHLVLDLGWNTLLASLAGSGRGRLPAGVYRIVLRACGVFVMALSVYFVYTGARLVAGLAGLAR
jgi:threonine/homoserine/homoserine lactone efflux protein